MLCGVPGVRCCHPCQPSLLRPAAPLLPVLSTPTVLPPPLPRPPSQVAALLELCADSRRPLSAQVHLAGERELWRFTAWRECPGLPGLWLAASAVQSSSGEGSPRNEYRVRSLEARPAARASGEAGGGSRFAPPPTPLLPADSTFLPGEEEAVPAWHTVSGHRWGWVGNNGGRSLAKSILCLSVLGVPGHWPASRPPG